MIKQHFPPTSPANTATSNKDDGNVFNLVGWTNQYFDMINDTRSKNTRITRNVMSKPNFM